MEGQNQRENRSKASNWKFFSGVASLWKAGIIKLMMTSLSHPLMRKVQWKTEKTEVTQITINFKCQISKWHLHQYSCSFALYYRLHSLVLLELNQYVEKY